MKNSNIEWCDSTFNPWEGCTKVSPGCANCYAENRNARFGGGTAPNWGKGAPRRRTSASNWAQPVKWNNSRVCVACGHAVGGVAAWCPECFSEAGFRRPRVFCASLADWLDDEVQIEWLADLLLLIDTTPHLDWLLLTKRPENWRGRITAVMDWIHRTGQPAEKWWVTMGRLASWLNGHRIPANVCIGTTVEDQTRADERIPALLEIPARVRFLSCEPLLGPVDVLAPRHWRGRFDAMAGRPFAEIHWVICGGESGPKARPMHPDWARGLRDQCKEAGVPFLFKQWGEWFPFEENLPADATIEGFTVDGVDKKVIQDGRIAFARVGKHCAGRQLDGIEHNQFPEN